MFFYILVRSMMYHFKENLRIKYCY